MKFLFALLVVFAAVLALFHQADAGDVPEPLPVFVDTRPEHCRNIPYRHGECICPTIYDPVWINGCKFGNDCEAHCAHPDWVEKWANWEDN